LSLGLEPVFEIGQQVSRMDKDHWDSADSDFQIVLLSVTYK